MADRFLPFQAQFGQVYMSISNGNNLGSDSLQRLNAWARRTHEEIQESGSPAYEPTSIEPLDSEYRKELGDYLRDCLKLDYSATMSVIDSLKSTYHREDDLFIVSNQLLNSQSELEQNSYMAHEQGHRLGKKISKNRLEPLERSHELPAEEYRQLFQYLRSEEFAERAKLAMGQSMGEEFEYNHNLIEDKGSIYARKGSLGPENLVDPDRNEDLEEMAAEIEDLLVELSSGEPSWSTR